MIVNLNVGLLTPPPAVCLFAAADISRDPFTKVAVAVLPFLVASLKQQELERQQGVPFQPMTT
jgi:TRAP-type C4-dicarboxylate transport system permease large subunit